MNKLIKKVILYQRTQDNLTFNEIIIDLRENIFEGGKAYEKFF